MRSVRLNPSLIACLQFSFTLIGSVLVLAVMFDIAGELIRGRPMRVPSLQSIERTLTSIAIVASGLGTALFGIFWISGVTINENGLRGRTFWGRRIAIAWDEVASVRKVFVSGIPSLIVRSASSNKELWLPILGRDVRRVYLEIRTYVAPNHPLTQWLSLNYPIRTEVSAAQPSRPK
jgi:hypothetical protein